MNHWAHWLLGGLALVAVTVACGKAGCAEQTGITFLNGSATLCQANNIGWTLTHTADTSSRFCRSYWDAEYQRGAACGGREHGRRFR